MYLSYRRVTLLVVLIAVSLAAAGAIYWYGLAAYTASLDTRPLRIGLVGEIKTLVPAALETHEEMLAASAMYEGLVIYDEKTDTIKPCLAKSWKYSADGKTLTIQLRRAQFSNGKLLTAAAVQAAWEKSFSSTRDWPSISLFLPVSGASERLDGRTPTISGLEAVGNYTLRIKLEKPNSTFLKSLTNPIFWVYDTEDTVDPPAGTGPFVLQDAKQGQSIIVIRNEKYYQDQTPLSAIQFKIYQDPFKALSDFKSQQLDYLNEVPSSEIKNVKNDAAYKGKFIDRNLWETYCLGFNMNREPFSGNYLLRRALNFAVDRTTIIDNILGGSYRSSKGAIPAGLPGYNKQMRGYAYDPQKAKDLLAEAGYPEGEGLKPLILNYNRDEGHQAVAEAVAQQFNQLGIDVQLQELEWDYYKKQLGRTDLTLFRISWRADYPDADNFLYGMFHSSRVGISNYSGYNNPQVNKIMDAARAEIKSNEERLKLLQRAEEIIVDDAPMLWLFQKKASALVGDNVRNLEMDGMGMLNWHKVELLKPTVDGQTDTSTDKEV